MKEEYRFLGKYIRQVDIRNKEGRKENLLGVSVQKQFIQSIANTVGTDFKKYKIVKKGQFTYIPDTSRRGDKIAIALLEDYEEGLVSNVYTVFEVIDTEQLLPEYLMLWFKRPEFDRYARFKSHGSVREIMDWDEMCKVELPVPDIEKQRKIVKAYKTIIDRIMLKQNINDNLAAELNTIYSKWYKNFESPFAGEQRNMSDAGELPYGWKIAELGDFIESYSKTHEFNKDRLVFLNTSDILAGDFLCNDYMAVADMPGQAKKEIRQGDILFSEIRPANKRYALVTFPSEDYVVSTKLMVLRTTQRKLSNLRFYHLLTMDKTLEELHREADGKSGTFPQITFDENLRHRKFIVADDETERQFERILQSYYQLQQATKKEIVCLEQTKTLLLSKLSR